MGLHTHHPSKLFMDFPLCFFSSSCAGIDSRTLRLGGNSANCDYSSQDEEKSAVDEWEIDVLPDRKGTGSEKVSVIIILVA